MLHDSKQFLSIVSASYLLKLHNLVYDENDLKMKIKLLQTNKIIAFHITHYLAICILHIPPYSPCGKSCKYHKNQYPPQNDPKSCEDMQVSRTHALTRYSLIFTFFG